jgi:NAD+ diphosphatase
MAEQHTQAPPTVAFAGGTLDRAAHLRADDENKALRRRDTSSVILVGTAQEVATTADAHGLARIPVRDLPAAAPLTFLGLDPSQAAIFAADAIDLRTATTDTFTPLRSLMAELDPDEAALGAYAVGMVGWHRVHRHCGRCGAATNIEQAGHRRQCPNCGLVQFPRTDPVVTMLVQAGDRALLSRRQGAPAHRWSALAGFVEPGETPEEAVMRETQEETGINVAAVEYVASQPWPFPSALMLGFWAFVDPADAGAPEPELEPSELVEARWFERSELTAAIGAGRIVPPPVGTIGNYLISTWLAGSR